MAGAQGPKMTFIELTRIERGLLGNRSLPADGYCGVHTLRAVENLPIWGQAIGLDPDLITALAGINQAAAVANAWLGLLDAARRDAIIGACEDMPSSENFSHAPRHSQPIRSARNQHRCDRRRLKTELDAAEPAVTTGVSKAASGLQTTARGQITGAAFGQGLANSIRK